MANSFDELFEKLRVIIKTKYKLPPTKPTDEELENIIRELIFYEDKDINEELIDEIVKKYIEFEGLFLYEGLDMSDIGEIMKQIKKELEK